MNDKIIRSKKSRKTTYTIESRGNDFYVVSYNSMMIPEVLYQYKSEDEAKHFFASLPGK
jgi:hypothetical protein